MEGFNHNFKDLLDSQSNAIGKRPVKAGRVIGKLKDYNGSRAREFLIKSKRRTTLNLKKDPKEKWAKTGKINQTKGGYFQNKSLLSIKKPELKNLKAKKGKKGKRFKLF